METYLWNEIQRHVSAGRQSWHTPGHKSGRVAPQMLKEAWGGDVFRYDLTEVGRLDVLYQETGVLAQSQHAMAEAFEAAFACYLAGGSTLGLLASVYALGRGQTVLVGRHAHQSVWHALALAGAQVVPLMPEQDDEGRFVGVAERTLAQALEDHPKARLLVVTDPTYYGDRYENETLAALAQSRGLRVLVDGAHSAHFGWHKALPSRPAGDVVVASLHKMLPALTGAAVLYGRDPALLAPIRSALRLFASTSPNYLVLAGSELAVAEAAGREGRARWGAAAEKGRALAAALKNTDGVRVHQGEDPLRLHVAVDGFRGTELSRALAQAGHDVEMADGRGVLLLFGADGPSDHLRSTVQNLALRQRKRAGGTSFAKEKPPSFQLPEVCLPMVAALFAPGETLPLEKAVGRVAAEHIMAYPPGCPLVLPGERIEAHTAILAVEAGLQPNTPVRVVEKGWRV